MYRFILGLVILLLFSCRPTVFKYQTLPAQKPQKISQTKVSNTKNWDKIIQNNLKNKYNKLGRPSFAIIKNYYKLPEKKPYGQALVYKNYTYSTEIELSYENKVAQDYALTPITGDEAINLQEGINLLLDLGVDLKEISFADAIKLAQLEQESSSNNIFFKPSKILAPSVDYLISIYNSNFSSNSNSRNQSVLVGRVIKKDGSLMAFRVINNFANKKNLSTMITMLFEDVINRI